MDGSTLTPIARAVRTFAAAMTGVLGAAVLIDWNTVAVADLEPLVLGVVTAVLASVGAFLLALKGKVATNPVGRAVATALQIVGAGVVTLGLSDLTGAAAVELGRGLGALVVTAILSGLLTLAATTAEGHPSS